MKHQFRVFYTLENGIINDAGASFDKRKDADKFVSECDIPKCVRFVHVKMI